MLVEYLRAKTGAEDLISVGLVLVFLILFKVKEHDGLCKNVLKLVIPIAFSRFVCIKSFDFHR